MSRYKTVGILLCIRPAQGRKRKLATADSMHAKDPYSLRQFSLYIKRKWQRPWGPKMRGAMPHCFSTAATLVLVDEELTAELWVHEVFNGQNLVQGSLIEQALLQDEFLDALAGL